MRLPPSTTDTADLHGKGLCPVDRGESTNSWAAAPVPSPPAPRQPLPSPLEQTPPGVFSPPPPANPLLSPTVSLSVLTPGNFHRSDIPQTPEGQCRDFRVRLQKKKSPGAPEEAQNSAVQRIPRSCTHHPQFRRGVLYNHDPTVRAPRTSAPPPLRAPSTLARGQTSQTGCPHPQPVPLPPTGGCLSRTGNQGGGTLAVPTQVRSSLRDSRGSARTPTSQYLVRLQLCSVA